MDALHDLAAKHKQTPLPGTDENVVRLARTCGKLLATAELEDGETDPEWIRVKVLGKVRTAVPDWPEDDYGKEILFNAYRQGIDEALAEWYGDD